MPGFTAKFIEGVHYSLVGAALALYNKPYPREMITYQRRQHGLGRGKRATDVTIHTKFFPRYYYYMLALFEHKYEDGYNTKLVGVYEARRLASKGFPGVLITSYTMDDVRKSLFLVELTGKEHEVPYKASRLSNAAIKTSEIMKLYDFITFDIHKFLLGEAPRYPHYSKYYHIGKAVLKNGCNARAALINSIESKKGIIPADSYFVDSDKDYGVIVGYTPFDYPLSWFRWKHKIDMMDPKYIGQIKLCYPEIDSLDRAVMSEHDIARLEVELSYYE